MHKRSDLAWFCATALLCLAGVSFADFPDFANNFPGTYGCELYIVTDESGAQAFSNPTFCGDWGENPGTSAGTACQGILKRSNVNADGTCVDENAVALHDNFKYSFQLSFDNFFNLTNLGASVNNSETLLRGHVRISTTGKFVSDTVSFSEASISQSAFRTTSSGTGTQKTYLLADNDENSDPAEITDGCINTDLRQFSNKTVGVAVGTEAGKETYFLYCVKISNDIITGSGGSAGGCFLSR